MKKRPSGNRAKIKKKVTGRRGKKVEGINVLFKHYDEQTTRKDVMSHRHPLWENFVRALQSVLEAKGGYRMPGMEVTEAILKVLPGINAEASLNWLREWAGDSDADILYAAGSEWWPPREEDTQL
jgi:hypothetical protein